MVKHKTLKQAICDIATKKMGANQGITTGTKAFYKNW